MGDAVRRVQKHLQELSRDHLTSVEDRHHANLGWLQIELQQLCKQIEVEVRVELTRPPRMSFSKANALLPSLKEADKSTKEPTTMASTTTIGANVGAAKPPLLPSPVQMPVTRLVFDAIDEEEPPRASKKRRLDETKKEAKESVPVEPVARKGGARTSDAIEVDDVSEDEHTTVAPKNAEEALPKTRVVKKMVKRTRKVLKPKTVVTKVKKIVKKVKPELPAIDVSALKVVDLKNELKKRGLKQTGVKAVLSKRLKEALEEEDAANAEDEDDDEEEVEEEIVEEVMEEVNEEYEMEIEEAIEETETSIVAVQQDKDDESMVEQDVDVAKADETSGVHPNQKTNEDVVDEASAERIQPEAAPVPTDDVELVASRSQDGAAVIVTESHTEDTPSMQLEDIDASDSTAGHKTSLSDIAPVSTIDEIVRESDIGSEGFLSPDMKTPAGKQASARKSLRHKLVAPSALAPIAESTAPPVQPVPCVAPTLVAATMTKYRDHETQADSLDRNEGVTNPTQHRTAATPGNDATATSKKIAVPNELDMAPQTKRAADLPSHLNETQNGVSTDALPPIEKSTRTVTPTASSAAKTSAAAPKGEPSKASETHVEALTPSRDLLARVKSLASSSRSSSVSSVSASRRYTGSINFVEDSQPDQSPHRISLMTDLSIQTNRAASISQLEMELLSSKAKTPDSTSAAPSSHERVAQSEPRLTAAKQQVEDEAERKRREQQENIQREAQRLRLAMKQSAKKRFEEAKGSSVVKATREQAMPQVPSDSTGSMTVLRRTESTSSIVSFTRDSPEPLASEPHQEPAERFVGSSTTASKTQEAKAAQVARKPVPVLPSQIEASSTPPMMPKDSTTAPTKTETETKRIPLTRKRSSIVVDSSTSTLYPSKKRASLTRSKEEAIPKRLSVTKDAPPTELPRKRASTSRDSSTTDAPKRKRSSLTREKAGTQQPTTKRSSITSSRAEEAVKVATSSSAAHTKTSAGATRTGPSSSRRDSVSSTVSSASNVSTSESRSKPTTSAMTGGAVRKPSNLVSGLHSFTSLLDKDTMNLSSSQSSNTSASSRAPGVSALKLAEKSRLLEQKKNLEKAKRKEALAKKYEEQRKADEEKRKKYALMKEKAERDARLKREQEQATEKKQRELELAKKRQQRLQEMRSGMEKKKATEKEAAAVSKASANAAPVSRIAASGSSAAPSQTGKSVAAKSTHSEAKRELTTYAMSENEESDSDGENDTKRNSKNIPVWAQREHLERTLRLQFGPNAVDPTPSIFPDFIDSCDLEAIFEPTDVRKKKRFQRRTSSGNWLGDRPTAREKAVYKREMGFQR